MAGRFGTRGFSLEKKEKNQPRQGDAGACALIVIIKWKRNIPVYTARESFFSFLFFRKTTHPIHILYVCGALESLDLIRFEAKPRTYFDSLHIVTRWFFLLCV
jgi:hypothetical protein